MYVSFIESNVKGGVRCALGPKTIIVGPNGSGKSGVVNAVELALTGSVSDLTGRREVKREIDLMALAPGRTGELFSRAVIEGAGEATWRAGGKGGKKAKHAVPALVDPATALPLRPVYEALMGSVETSRKFFLQYAVGGIVDKDVLDRIPATLHAFYRKATLATSMTTSSSVDRLLSALEFAKTQARDAKARAKMADALSSEQAQGLAPLPTEAQQKALNDAVKEAEAKLDATKGAAARNEALASAVAEQATLAQQIEAKLAEYNALRAEQVTAARNLSAMPVPQGANAEVLALRSVIEAHLRLGSPTCHCCGHGGVLLSGTATSAKDWQARLTWIDGVIAQTKDAVAAYENAKTHLATVEVKAQQARNEGERLWEQKQTLDAVVAAGAAPVPSAEEVKQIEDSLAALRQQQRDVDALKASWATASKAKDSAGDAKKEAEDWSSLSDACVEAVAALLDAGVEGFRAKVQAALPATDHFALTLRDGARAVFQYGLRREGTIHTALSGAEWARITAAMAGICYDPKKLAVVIPEERAFDPQTLHDVLGSFGHLDPQVIITSPVWPAAAIPPGWHIIDTTRDEHRGAALFETPALPTEVRS